jgi:hypothetical protein
MPFLQHPDIDGPPVPATDRQARVLAKSGWEPVALEDFTKAELLAEAERRGIPITKSARKAEIAEAIESYESQEG